MNMEIILWFFGIIIGALLLVLFIILISRLGRRSSATGTRWNWHWPNSANWRLIFAFLGAGLVLAIFFLTESTIAFLGLMFWSKVFWGLLLAFLVFWGIWTGNWTWLWRILGIAIATWIAIWIFGVIVHWNDPKPDSAGKPTKFTLYCQDNTLKVLSSKELTTPWQGEVCDYFLVNPAEGQEVTIIMPGPWGGPATRTVIRGQKIDQGTGKPVSTQPLPQRGYGQIKIIAK